MSKISRNGFALLLLLFLGSSAGNYAAASAKATADKSVIGCRPGSTIPVMAAELSMTWRGLARRKCLKNLLYVCRRRMREISALKL